jgi:hypothetical protein
MNLIPAIGAASATSHKRRVISIDAIITNPLCGASQVSRKRRTLAPLHPSRIFIEKLLQNEKIRNAKTVSGDACSQLRFLRWSSPHQLQVENNDV